MIEYYIQPIKIRSSILNKVLLGRKKIRFRLALKNGFEDVIFNL